MGEEEAGGGGRMFYAPQNTEHVLVGHPSGTPSIACERTPHAWQRGEGGGVRILVARNGYYVVPYVL